MPIIGVDARLFIVRLACGLLWDWGGGVPRPPCPRHIAHSVPCAFFKPAGVPLYELEEVVLAADEMEAVRLADGEDLYGTEAAVRMKVSRQTFDRILKRARGKIAHALVKGKALRIEEAVLRVRAKPARAKRV